MTIAALDKEIKDVISKHRVVGAEAVVNALVRACEGERYLEGDALRRILNNAIVREEKEVIAMDKSSIYPDIFVKHYIGGANRETHN